MAVRAAAASEAHVAQAAREALARGNAVDAVVAGLLVACASSPGVLLGPAQFLVAGAGVGTMAADGRVRQPGLGAPRPRGIASGGAVPGPATVGVPALPATIATVLASFGTATLRRLVAPALSAARALSPERAAVLDAFARRGAPAFTDDAIGSELVAVAGRAAGGALTRQDLASVRPALLRVEERMMDPPGWLRVPWAVRKVDASCTHVVAAADARGLVCIACYESPLDVGGLGGVRGVDMPALGLVGPALAAPVMRGLPRVRPGESRPASAPIALRARRGRADLAVGLAQCPDADAALLELLVKLDESPVVADTLAGSAGRPVAVVRTRDAAAVAASA